MRRTISGSDTCVVGRSKSRRDKVTFSSGFVFWLILVGPASVIGGVIAWMNHVSIAVIAVVIVFLLGLAVSFGSVSTPVTRSMERKSKKTGSAGGADS
jgi:cytochrome c biogenesis protein CcdA